MTIADGSRDWVEVADRCFMRRYSSFDVNVGVVVGTAGLAVIDTRASLSQGSETAGHVRELSHLPVSGVVNTHQHFDHTYGNAAFPGVRIVAHESVPEDLAEDWARIRDDAEGSTDDPFSAEVLATPLVVPDTTFSSVCFLDLGDRTIELAYPGRGHTRGDILVRVPDADVVYAGDLVEQSGPPSYGEDCWPLEWGATLDLAIGLMTPGSTVVPGHGDAVDREFVQAQRQDVIDVAEQIRELAGSARTVDDALALGTWPFPPERLVAAVRRGFTHLRG
ncbi:MAG: MBL fold metallo-hydrolase [Nocardioidaceae bacterium]